MTRWLNGNELADGPTIDVPQKDFLAGIENATSEWKSVIINQ